MQILSQAIDKALITNKKVPDSSLRNHSSAKGFPSKRK
jgi:hypothetical protein